MISENELEQIILTLLESIGIDLVEISVGRHRGDVRLILVVYRKGGIGLDDLTTAQKVLRPRLELEIERERLSVEVSSPGLGRIIKNPKEYKIFEGRTVRILIGGEWLEGEIIDSDGRELRLRVNDQEIPVLVERIQKARLE